MIPDKDYYVDASGKLTDDPAKYAAQVAVAGVFLDERHAKRYGISDVLVSVDEPGASRRVMGRNESSVRIQKIEDKTESAPKAETPEATSTEPKAKKGAKSK
jgi:ribosomal protein S11